jgi:hypothetical protein
MRKLKKNDNMNNLFNIAQQAGIEGPQLKQRFDSLNKQLVKLKEAKRLREKNPGVVKERPVVTEFVKGVVKTFKKITDIDEMKKIFFYVQLLHCLQPVKTRPKLQSLLQPLL